MNPQAEERRREKEAYAQTVEKIRRREDPPRALAIEAWLKDLPEPLQFLHQEKLEMIVNADPRKETGLCRADKRQNGYPERDDRCIHAKVDICQI